jgi:hypothetical protein
MRRKRREILKAITLMALLFAEMFLFADGFWERRAVEANNRNALIAAEGGMTE